MHLSDSQLEVFHGRIYEMSFISNACVFDVFSLYLYIPKISWRQRNWPAYAIFGPRLFVTSMPLNAPIRRRSFLSTKRQKISKQRQIPSSKLMKNKNSNNMCRSKLLQVPQGFINFVNFLCEFFFNSFELIRILLLEFRAVRYVSEF